MNDRYLDIVKHYESCFEKYGPCEKGMDWPNRSDLIKRFKVMTELFSANYVDTMHLLDLGCGIGLYRSYLAEQKIYSGISYKGIDISEKMIRYAQQQYPHDDFETRDIFVSPFAEKSFDFIVMNGVLTEKVQLSHDAMERYAQKIIKAAYGVCRQGIAFNVMNDHVDWRREDLFHWPLDRAVAFLTKECSRHIVLRMDYGLYEYTVYVYREARA